MIHTPRIIIKLLGESIRSQAVSTLLMRSTTNACGAGFTMNLGLGVTLYFACKTQRKITLLTLMSHPTSATENHPCLTLKPNLTLLWPTQKT
jgi:hypothetical protein